jgi:hypothetical protein
MSTDAKTQDARLSPTPAGTWFSVIAPPLAWATQGLFGWFVSGAGCRDGRSYWGVSLSTLTTAAIVVSVIALAVAVAGIVLGYRGWTAAEDRRPDLNVINGRTRAAYLAASGVLISGMFAVGIVWAGLGAILVNPCGQTR